MAITVTGSPPNGIVGVPYTFTFSAADPTTVGTSESWTWDISAGSIPTGLTFPAQAQTTAAQPVTAVLSGVPTTAGTFTFTVRATNATGNGTDPVTVVIAAQQLSICFRGVKRRSPDQCQTGAIK
jgi:large repetitive protein